MGKKVTKAIIPAAGLGTRFLPVTKAMPKEMLPIVDKPTIQYIVEEAIASGIEDIIIVTGKGSVPLKIILIRILSWKTIYLKKASSNYLKKSSIPQTWKSIIYAKKSRRA